MKIIKLAGACLAAVKKIFSTAVEIDVEVQKLERLQNPKRNVEWKIIRTNDGKSKKVYPPGHKKFKPMQLDPGIIDKHWPDVRF